LALGQACLNGFVLYLEAGHDTPRTQGFHSGQMREALRGEYKACFRGSRGVQDFEATVLHCGDVQSNEPTPHKSVDYKAFKRGFQASRNQSQSLYMALTK
jgi:hypothetical protein